jgi:ribose 1,5-bisphosphokinase PhnN
MEEFVSSLLLITGGMGAGKTTVMAEASDLLAVRGVFHAAIDVDALGLAFLPPIAVGHGDGDLAMNGNLRSVCRNYAALSVERFILARAIEDRAQLETCRDAASATEVVVCRIVASVETMRQRLQMRETGIAQQEYLANAARLDASLDRARLEDFSVTNENRAVTDVAFEILVKSGWISS